MKLGFGVKAIWNGKEALDYLNAAQKGHHSKPDIILMDVQMPIIDGYKCTHLLRHHAPFKSYVQDVPIVAMTASAIQGDREKCKRAGMDDYLAKPVRSAILEKMLVKWSLSRRLPSSALDAGSWGSSICSDSSAACRSTDIPGTGQDMPVPLTANRILMPESSTEGPSIPAMVRSPGEIPPSPPPTRLRSRAETEELALRLQAEKLMEAASARAPLLRGTSFHRPLPPTAALTEENMERLKREEVKRQEG